MQKMAKIIAFLFLLANLKKKKIEVFIFQSTAQDKIEKLDKIEKFNKIEKWNKLEKLNKMEKLN